MIQGGLELTLLMVISTAATSQVLGLQVCVIRSGVGMDSTSKWLPFYLMSTWCEWFGASPLTQKSPTMSFLSLGFMAVIG